MKCRYCGQNLAQDAEVCEECGTPVSAPDNKNEINKMFAETGETSLYYDSALISEMESAGIDSAKVDFGSLSDADMKRIADSGAILEHQLEKDISEMRDAEIAAAEAEEEKADPKAYKKKKAERERQKKKLEKEKKRAEKNKGTGNIARTMLIFVLTFIVSAALGGVGTVYFLYRQYADPEWVYGYNAALAVQNSLPKGQTFIPCEIYVKKYEEKAVCVVFGEIRKKAGDYENVRMRVSVNLKNPKEAVLFAPFDEEKYNSMKNGSQEEQIAAALMKERNETLNTEIADMNRSKNDWIRLKTGYITAKLGEGN